MNLAVTGHRPQKLGGFKPCRLHNLIKEAIRNKLTELKPDYGISGMALGVDQWFAAECVALGIPFIAAIPFSGQELAWPESSQKEYKRLLALAYAKEIVVPGGYAAWKMQKRNEWMVHQCHQLLAVWDGSDGGTGNCVQFCRTKYPDRPIHIIKPSDL